jgi:hypothetical protein
MALIQAVFFFAQFPLSIAMNRKRAGDIFSVGFLQYFVSTDNQHVRAQVKQRSEKL